MADVKLTIQAQDKASDDLKKIVGALGDAESAAHEAATAMKGAGASSDGLDDDTQGLKFELEDMRKALDAVNKELSETKKKLDDTDNSGKESGKSWLELAGMLSVAKQAYELVKGAAESLSESLTRSAERGDVMAQATLGAARKAQAGMDKLTSAITQGLLPLLQPLLQWVGKIIEATTKWVTKNKVIQKVIGVVIKAIGVLVIGAGVLTKAIAPLVRLWSEGWGKLLGLIVRGVAFLIKRFKVVGQSVLDLAITFAVLSEDDRLLVKLSKYQKNFGKLSGDLKKFAGSLETISLDVSGTGDAMVGAGQKMLQFGSDTAAGMTQASTETAKFSEQAFNQAKVALETKLSLLGDNFQAQLDLLQSFHEQWKDNETVNREEILDIETRIADKQKELRDQQLAEQQARIEEADAAASDEIDRILERSDRKQEILQGELEAELERIEILRTIGADENQLRDMQIAAYQAVAHSSEASAQTRMSAEKQVSKLMAQEAALRVKNQTASTQKIVGTFGDMAKAMLLQGASLKSVLSNLWKSLAGELIDSIVQMVVKHVTQAAVETAGVKAAASAQAGAQAATVPSAIASWTAAIPFGGPAVFSGYLATFQGLMAAGSAAMRGLGAFAEGGPIPGFGGGDRMPILAEPGEFIMRRSASEAIGHDVLNGINQSGQLPGAAGPESGGQRLRIVMDLADNFQDTRFGQLITEAVNFHVVHEDGELMATGLALEGA